MNKLLLLLAPLLLGVVTSPSWAGGTREDSQGSDQETHTATPESVGTKRVETPDDDKAKQSAGTKVAFQVTGMKKTKSGAT